MHCQDGIECYECEATYGSFKYGFWNFKLNQDHVIKGSDEDTV